MQDQDSAPRVYSASSTHIGGGCSGQAVLTLVGSIVVTVMILSRTPVWPHLVELFHRVLGAVSPDRCPS
jgi:hypothetical protein